MSEITVTYEKEDKTIEFVYIKNKGEIEEKIVNKEDAFTYTIDYNATIKDYVGEATTKLIDTLPYEIDEERSNLDGGLYDKDAKTITWIVKTTIGEKNQNISITKNISVYYIGIDTNEVKNDLNVTTSYDSEKSKTDDSAKTIVATGKVIVHYLNEDGEKISDDETINGFVGDAYKVSTKDFALYYLDSTKGETEGKFTKDDIEVTFIYGLSGTGDVEPEEILPPQTGFEASEYYTLISIKYLLAIVLVIVGKKKLFA